MASCGSAARYAVRLRRLRLTVTLRLDLPGYARIKGVALMMKEHGCGRLETLRTSGGRAERQIAMLTRPSKYSSDKIVLMRARNKHANELAELGNEISRRIVNQHTSVNIRSLRLHSSLPQQFTFVRFTFE